MMTQGMDGIALIIKERLRQIVVEKYDEVHDDTHTKGEMLDAAMVYCQASGLSVDWAVNWPWSLADFHPGTHIENLVKAGALIAAEIDRLQRLAVSNQPAKG